MGVLLKLLILLSGSTPKRLIFCQWEYSHNFYFCSLGLLLESSILGSGSSTQHSRTQQVHLCLRLSVHPSVCLKTEFLRVWSAYDCLWQLMTTYDSLWKLMTTYDSLWQLLTAYDNFWQLLTTFDNFWKLMTTLCRIGLLLLRCTCSFELKMIVIVTTMIWYIKQSWLTCSLVSPLSICQRRSW